VNSVYVFLRSPLAAGFLISTLVFLGIVTVRNTGSLESTELAAYDWQIRLQPKRPESKSASSSLKSLTIALRVKDSGL
jgi:CHASE2 domain-containing sensor protein